MTKYMCIMLLQKTFQIIYSILYFRFFIALLKKNIEIIINDDKRLQSNPHLDCIICHGHIATNPNKHNANFLSLCSFAISYIRINAIILKTTAGILIEIILNS